MAAHVDSSLIRALLHVLVVVLLSLVDLLSKSSLIDNKSTKYIDIDRLEKHTSELTPKVLIIGEHGHHASIDGLTNSLLLCLRSDSCRLRSDSGLLRLGLRLLGLLGLIGRTTAGGLTVLEVAWVLGLTGEHAALSVGSVHVGREGVHTHGREHLLTRRIHTHGVEALLTVLGFKHSMTIALLLSKSKIKRLAVEEVVHALLDSSQGRFVGGKVTETKALAVAIGVLHDNAALDLTMLAQETTEIVVSDGISEVTDVHVSLGGGVAAVKVALELEGGLMFVLLLGTSNVEVENDKAVLLELLNILTLLNRANKSIILPLVGLLVQGLLSLDSIFVLLKVDKTEATADTVTVGHDNRGSDFAEFREHLLKILRGELQAEVLNVDVGVSVVGIAGTEVLGDELLSNKLLTKTLELILVLLAGLKSLDRVLNLSELDETIAKAGTIILGLNLAGGDCTKVGENILKLNKSDVLVKVLDKQVTLTALTLRGVTARPHDTAGLALQCVAIEGIKSLLSILGVLEVDVCITKRMLILNITANTDGKDVTTLLEGIVDIGFTDIRAKITNIKGVAGIDGGSGNRGGSRLLGRHYRLFFYLGL
jgi:hypothetical protein